MTTSVIKDRRLLLLISANLAASIGMGILSLGVAWLLVDRDQGEKLLGLVMVVTTMMLFVGAPYIGSLIDRFRENVFFNSINYLSFLLFFQLRFTVT
ncbi:hypothetical protein [Bacillus sp. JCM 19041]|uniref:hypothetical protein n=1 Tax=Bacillus sp. JCM 19041 TaxID=1460637 RepID=UPI0006D2B37C